MPDCRVFYFDLISFDLNLIALGYTVVVEVWPVCDLPALATLPTDGEQLGTLGKTYLQVHPLYRIVLAAAPLSRFWASYGQQRTALLCPRGYPKYSTSAVHHKQTLPLCSCFQLPASCFLHLLLSHHHHHPRLSLRNYEPPTPTAMSPAQ